MNSSWNGIEMQKQHKLKANDRGTKTENTKNLKPTRKCPKLAGKMYENRWETQEFIQKPQFSQKSHSNNHPQML